MANSERVSPDADRVERVGVHIAPDGRLQPNSGEEEVSDLPRDTAETDGTPSGTAVGTVAGAGLGAVIGGPIGAVVGAVAGAAAGKIAHEANREDENVPTGNPTDDDRHRVKHDYFTGQIYEEGSLVDVPRRSASDVQARDIQPRPQEEG
jgi:uncharacterized protein YcfJ